MDWGLLNAIGITAMAIFGLWILWRSHEKGVKTGNLEKEQASTQENRAKRGRAL